MRVLSILVSVQIVLNKTFRVSLKRENGRPCIQKAATTDYAQDH